MFLIITFLSCILGAILQSVCGFGNGPVNMTILPYIMSYGDAMTLTTLFGITISSVISLTYIRHINFRTLVPCSTASIIFTVLSVQFSLGVARTFMMHSLGAMLIAISVYNIFFCDRIKIRPTLVNGIMSGILTGIFTGLFAAGGPPAAIFLLAASKTNYEYMGTINALFAISAAVSIFMRTLNGTISSSLVYTWFIMLIVIAAGFWGGSRIFRGLDSKRLGLAVYGYIMISRVIMLFN